MASEVDESGIKIIWLDKHIGVLGAYKEFKEKFTKNLRPITGVPGKSINDLILCFEREVAPITYVPNCDDAIAEINNDREKRIIFISSFALGHDIVPTLIQGYPRVYSFYLFCFDIIAAAEWAYDYQSCLQIFTSETDLLTRLARDISKEFIKIGRAYFALEDGEMARRYFVTAATLEIHANQADPRRAPLMISLNILQGPNGLIQKSENLKDEQREDEHVSLNGIQYILLDLSSQMSGSQCTIIHFLKLFLRNEVLITVDNLQTNEVSLSTEKATCLLANERPIAEHFKERFGLLNVSIYALHDGEQSFNTIDRLIDKLVQLIIEKYEQQAVEHLNSGHIQLADMEKKIADRIKYEVEKMKET